MSRLDGIDEATLQSLDQDSIVFNPDDVEDTSFQGMFLERKNNNYTHFSHIACKTVSCERVYFTHAVHELLLPADVARPGHQSNILQHQSFDSHSFGNTANQFTCH